MAEMVSREEANDLVRPIDDAVTSIGENGSWDSDTQPLITALDNAAVQARDAVEAKLDQLREENERLRTFARGEKCFCLPYLPCTRCIALMGREKALAATASQAGGEKVEK